MQSEPLIEVFATAKFQRDLRTLAKKYRHIRSDVQPIIHLLITWNYLPITGIFSSFHSTEAR